MMMKSSRIGTWVVTIMAVLLTACSSQKSQFAEALNNEFDAHPVCSSLRAGATPESKFPRTIPGDITANKTLRLLQSAGLITMNNRPASAEELAHATSFYFSGISVLSLTDKGKSDHIWDEQKGFCIGNYHVDEIQKWTEPAESNGAMVTEVQYTWKLEHLHDGLDKNDLQDFSGIGSAQSATATLKKMNDGWEVVSNGIDKTGAQP
jgi:hypothetical protein